MVFQPPVGVDSAAAPGPRWQSWRNVRGRRPVSGSRSHTIETLNGTAWSSSAEYIQSSRGVDVFLIQETHLPPARVAVEEDWCKVRRLRGALSAATPSGEGGWRGGSGILARDAYGMAPFRSAVKVEVVVGRAMLAHLGGLIKGGYGLATVYLWTSEGVSARNLAILGALGAAIRGLGVPFIIGGDWNMQPEALELTGWVVRLGARVVAPSDNTFVPTAAAGDEEAMPVQGSKLDYYVVSEAFLPLVSDIRVVDAPFIA